MFPEMGDLLKCKISRGAFSGERIVRFNGEVACVPFGHCYWKPPVNRWFTEFVRMLKDEIPEPGERLIGLTDVKIASRNGDTVKVQMADGEFREVPADLIVREDVLGMTRGIL